MARSKIIKEIVNNEISLEVGLSRIKVIVYSLKNDTVSNWISSELNGYDNDDVVPPYRSISSDKIKYSGLCGTMQLTNVDSSIYVFPKEISDNLKRNFVREGIATIEEKAKPNMTITKNLIHLSEYMYENNETQCTSLYQIYSSSQFKGILAKIKQIIIDILLELENEFGNLDEMDINLEEKSKKDLKKFNQILVQIIYKDESVKIGDKNKITDTNITSVIEKK